jgi:glyoxylase-like metal-dependent hydrolase (beta-lactamase superfamily II)
VARTESFSSARADAAAATYEVTAIRYGSLRSTRGELYHRWSSYGEPDGELEMAYYFWLLRGAGSTVLVDTGFASEAAARRGRQCLIEPVEALARLGVEPADVSTVVVSHFHYDHVGNLDAFPDAELVVGRTELDFWTGPLARRAQFAPHVDPPDIERIAAAVAAGRARTTSGEEEILPGVRTIEVGGHSPGQLLVVVDGEDGGRVVLTSDSVHFYEEMDLDRPFGVVADLGAMYRAYDTVAELGRDEATAIVAGHDPAVMERFAGEGGATEFAVEVRGTESEGKET